MTGGAGFSRDANNSLRKNLGYLDKFRNSHFKRTDTSLDKETKKTENFANATPALIASIKKQLVKERRLNSLKSMFLMFFLLLLLSVCVWLLIF